MDTDAPIIDLHNSNRRKFSKLRKYLYTKEIAKDDIDHDVNTEGNCPVSVQGGENQTQGSNIQVMDSDDAEENTQLGSSSIQQDTNRDSQVAEDKIDFVSTNSDIIKALEISASSKESEHDISKSTSVQKDIKFKPVVEKTPFAMDGLASIELEHSLKRKQRDNCPKNVIPEYAEGGGNQTHESSFEEDYKVAENVQFCKLDKLEEGSKTEITKHNVPSHKLDHDQRSQESFRNTGQLKIDVPSKESDHDIFKYTSVQKDRKVFKVGLWIMMWGTLFVVLECVQRVGFQSWAERWRTSRKAFLYDKAKNTCRISQLPDNVKVIPEVELCYTEEKVRDPIYLQRGQHITIQGQSLLQKIFRYRHHAIVLGVIRFSGPQVELELRHYKKEFMKKQIMTTREVCDIDELHIIFYPTPKFSPDEIVERAMNPDKKIFKFYNATDSNCETFSHWCSVGIPISLQAEKLNHLKYPFSQSSSRVSPNPQLKSVRKGTTPILHRSRLGKIPILWRMLKLK